MRNLIIPCAGGRMVGDQPLYLQRHPDDGMLLCIKAMIDIFPETYDQIILTFLKSDNEQYYVKDEIDKEVKRLKLSLPLNVFLLDQPTNGPADTIYETINKMDVVGEVVVKDSTNYQKLQNKVQGNFVVGLDLTSYDDVVENLRRKSFISVNEQGQILDIIEKKIRTDIISTGVYGFKNAEDFMKAYERLNDSDYPTEKLYVSHVISYLIGVKSKVFHCYKTTKFEDWSTINSWVKSQKKYSTLFLDLDSLFEDGISDKQLAYLYRKNIEGCKYVFLSSKGDIYNKELVSKMLKRGISNIHTICNCTASSEKHIISDWKQLERL